MRQTQSKRPSRVVTLGNHPQAYHTPLRDKLWARGRKCRIRLPAQCLDAEPPSAQGCRKLCVCNQVSISARSAGANSRTQPNEPAGRRRTTGAGSRPNRRRRTARATHCLRSSRQPFNAPPPGPAPQSRASRRRRGFEPRQAPVPQPTSATRDQPFPQAPHEPRAR